MANILYRGSAIPSTVNSAGGKNAALTNVEIDQNFYALERDKFDKVLGGTITGNATFASSSTVTIDGNLIVNGTTTTINSTTVDVDDINITLGSVASPTNVTANGGGITLKGTTDKTFNWYSSTSAWTSSEHLSLAAGKNILLNGSTSGTITLAVPASAGINTITFQAASGTVAHLSNIGDGSITVNTGSGLSGSGSFTTNQNGATTITLSHADTSSVTDLSSANNTFITAQTYDTFGHVLTRTTGTVDFTVSANYAFQNIAIASNSGYTWGTANTNTTQSADSSSDTFTLVRGGGINLYTSTVSGTDAVLIEHADTSSVSDLSVDNSNGTVLQDIALTFDTYGHVTGISAASIDGDARWVNTSGDTMTGLLISRSTTGAIGVNTQGTSGFEVYGGASTTADAAYMTFHRPGSYAVRFGLDTDNILKVGGWSMGNVAHTIWHSGNDGSGSGLDADTVDGLHIHTGRNNEANRLVRTDASGYIQAGYINSSSGDEKNASNPSYVWGTNGSDSYLRTYSTGSLSVNYANSAGSAGSAGYTTKLRRRDDASDYNVQTSWGTDKTGYWSLRGYSGDTYHAGVWVAWAGDATNAGYSSTVGINYNNDSNSTYSMLWGSGNSVYGTGGIYCNPSTDMLYADSFNATSDIRKKHNVKTIENALSKVEELRGVSFTMNDSGKNMIGVVAQEILEVIPEVVDEGSDGTLTVAYGNIVGVLIEAIKELNAKVEDLQNQLANK